MRGLDKLCGRIKTEEIVCFVTDKSERIFAIVLTITGGLVKQNWWVLERHLYNKGRPRGRRVGNKCRGFITFKGDGIEGRKFSGQVA